MKTETRDKNWVPILEVKPTDKFVCKYGGPFAQRLEINTGAVNRFLNLAQLGKGNGRLLLEESTMPKILVRPEVNSDMSVTGKRSLNWDEGDDFWDEDLNPFSEVVVNPVGARISVNGNHLLEYVREDEKLNANQVAKQFADSFNREFGDCLKSVVAKDKWDPNWKKQKVKTIFSAVSYYLDLQALHMNALFIADGIGLQKWESFELFGPTTAYLLGLQAIAFWMANKSPIWSRVLPFFRRETVKSNLEACGMPVELDRLALAYGYIGTKQLLMKPLVRLAN